MRVCCCYTLLLCALTLSPFSLPVFQFVLMSVLPTPVHGARTGHPWFRFRAGLALPLHVRAHACTQIAKYRKDKEGVKGSLVMNAAYDGPQTDANAVIASVDGGDLAHANPLSPQNAKFAANPVSMIEEYTATPTKKLQPISLTEKQQFAAKKDINSLKMEMEVHPDSRGNTSLLPDGTRYPEFEKPVNMGRRVNVKGYECEGVLRFFGPHKTKPGYVQTLRREIGARTVGFRLALWLRVRGCLGGCVCASNP